tara:strand:+ start:3211 stop:3465 length:255 start_codon:yes stop_codon:yes gene_type:complete
MKESKLLEMQNKVAALTRVVQQLINEIDNIKNLSVGTLETIKKMPDYNKALETLKKEMEKKAKMNEKKFETLEELQKEKEKKNK